MRTGGGKEIRLGLFSWKKQADDQAKPAAGAEAGSKAGQAGIEFSPEKARRFFAYAKNAMDTSQFEYAMVNWLGGLRQDPGNMDGIEGFFNAADRYRANGGTTLSKEVATVVKSSHPIDRYLTAVAEWAMKPSDAALAVRATVAPAELGLLDVAKWIAPKALSILVREAKPRKDHALKLMEVLQKAGLFDMALKACELAVRADPNDRKLSDDFKDLSAMAAMNKGGFDKTGEAGGFRSNIRDADAQQKLNEADTIVRSDAVADRVVVAARAEYVARPDDKPTIKKYVQALAARATPADELEAIAVLEKAFVQTQEFQFRKLAGELRIRRGRKELRALKETTAAAPEGEAGEAARKAFLAAEAKQLELEIAEFENQVKAYPTDLTIKRELGQRYVMAQRHEDAIGQLQQAKNDPRSRSLVMLLLGQCFVAMGWADEAVDTFRQATEQHADPDDATGMDLRYGLMTALEARAREGRDLSAAEEAYKLASAMAIQHISYRDIRARRDTLKGLVTEIKSGAVGGGGS